MNLMFKKEIRKKLLPMAALLIVAAAVGITAATVLHQMNLKNAIKTPTVEGEVTETMEDPDEKEVAFTNTGEADVLLRAAYTETWTWTDPKTKETVILPNITTDTDGNPVVPAAPKFVEASKNCWAAKEDGWIYYNKVLEAGEKTELLTESVEFSHLGELPDTRYSEADYQIHFTMEVVQASDKVDICNKAAKKSFGRGFSGSWKELKDKYTTLIKWE